MSIFTELYLYREMIFSFVRRDLRGRYKGSVLGFAWTFINPLLQLIVYTFVFSTILKSDIEDYYIFLFVALIPWIFFSTSLSAGSGCIKDQGNLVKKIYFPREVIPISFVTGQFINMVLCFAVIFAVLLISGKGFNFVALLYLPFVMILEYLLSLGFVLVLSGLVVYFRDLEHFMGIVTMVWQFVTPVMYDISIVPEKWLPLFYINPMTSIIVAYRDILYYKKPPLMSTLISAFLFSIIMCVFGFLLFSRLKKHFAEEL